MQHGGQVITESTSVTNSDCDHNESQGEGKGEDNGLVPWDAIMLFCQAILGS